MSCTSQFNYFKMTTLEELKETREKLYDEIRVMSENIEDMENEISSLGTKGYIDDDKDYDDEYDSDCEEYRYYKRYKISKSSKEYYERVTLISCDGHYCNIHAQNGNDLHCKYCHGHIFEDDLKDLEDIYPAVILTKSESKTEVRLTKEIDENKKKIKDLEILIKNINTSIKDFEKSNEEHIIKLLEDQYLSMEAELANFEQLEKMGVKSSEDEIKKIRKNMDINLKVENFIKKLLNK